MDEQPSKRRGRPRKGLPVPDESAQGKGVDDVSDGNREAGRTGSEPQAHTSGAGQGWDEFVSRVTELFKTEPRLRNVWHPEPKTDIVVTDNGSINVFQGLYKGQLNTGEFVGLSEGHPL